MKLLRDIHFNPDTQLPVISILTGSFALLLFLFGENASFLQYDRSAIAHGEIWRCVTGHWIHWSFDHFLWCTITFVALGCICENLSRKGFVATIVTASFVIPVVSWLADTGMHVYRGLSGLASGIFIFGALMMMRKTYVARDWLRFYLSAMAGFAYIGKILFEFASGSALFVNNPEVFLPVPIVHISGGMVGLLMVLIFSHKISNQSFIKV